MLVLLFPVATKTILPFPFLPIVIALLIAALIVDEGLPKYHEQFKISACASLYALIIPFVNQESNVVQTPVDCSFLAILIGIILLVYETPANPIPLFAIAPTIPAHAVPWESVAAPYAPFSVPSSVKLYPGKRFPARSGCERSTPISMIATLMDEAPVPKLHAEATFIFAPFELASDHWKA